MKQAELLKIITRLKKKIKKLQDEKKNISDKHIQAHKNAIDILKWMPPKLKKKKYKTRKAK